MVTLVHCSNTLWAWIGALTADDREKLRLWGISTKFLGIANVEVSRYLLCAAAWFWKPPHHVFRFGQIELTPTVEEVRRIYGLLRLLGPAIFMRRNSYLSVLNQLTRLRSNDCEHRLVCKDGDSPMLYLVYFDEVAPKRAVLGDDLWLHGFIVRFLGELVFSHGRMIVAIEVAEIALAVVTRQIDLVPVILAETYRALDRALWRCQHFYGCRALV